MAASWLQFFITIYGYGKLSSDIRKIKENVKMTKQLHRKYEIYNINP